MGLIKVVGGIIKNAGLGVLEDQLQDVFECSNMSSEILGTPATKIIRNGAHNNATENVISNGSVFNVSANQAAILVENGRVHDFVVATSPELAGQYRYDSKVEPSLIGGGFADFMPSVMNVLRRAGAGGQSTNVMRLYYINCQVLTGNKIGIGNITFRDGETGVNVKARAFGNYEIQIVNPVVFYENYVKNVSSTFDIGDGEGKRFIDNLKQEVEPEFQKALGILSQQGIRYELLGSHSSEITKLINESLKDSWLEKKGVVLVSMPLTITFDDESVKKILEIQELKNYTDDRMLRAKMGVSFANAAETAAGNTAGAMTGFMGMGMTGSMMGQQMQQFGFNGNMGQQQAYDPQAQVQNMPAGSLSGANMQQNAGAMAGMAGVAGATQANAVQEAPTSVPVQEASADTWTCTCGANNTGKFCIECGVKKPEAPVGWTCACGAVNKGKFCPECGAKKPADAPLYKCDKCNWEPEDPKNPPKFCPQCGDKFDESDVTN